MHISFGAGKFRACCPMWFGSSQNTDDLVDDGDEVSDASSEQRLMELPTHLSLLVRAALPVWESRGVWLAPLRSALRVHKSPWAAPNRLLKASHKGFV